MLKEGVLYSLVLPPVRVSCMPGHHPHHLSVFEPLAHILQRELESCGLEPPPLSAHASNREFTRWYLSVIQRLDAHVASAQDYPPMTRDEMELVSRCTMTAGNLQEAIQLCIRYLESIAPRAGRMRLLKSGEQAQIVLDSLRQQVSSARSLLDITGLFAYYQLFQWLVDRTIPLHQVRIGPAQRDDVLPFLKLFRAPVLAGGHDYAITLDTRALRWPVVRTGAEFKSFFELWPCNVFKTRQITLSQQLVTLLAAAVRSGELIPTQMQLAQDLDMSLSTFRRTLKNDGNSYRQLREAVVQEAAADLLLRDDVPIGRIATQLGFSDSGSFRRAFEKWHQLSPTEWRRNNKRSR